MLEWWRFPKELQLAILECLVEDDLIPRTAIASYAAVNTEWQIFFESYTFYHLTLDPDRLDDFERILDERRRRLVSHILIHVNETDIESDEWDLDEAYLIDTPAVHVLADTLLKFLTIISPWDISDNQRVTLELGTCSMYPGNCPNHPRLDTKYDTRREFYPTVDIDHNFRNQCLGPSAPREMQERWDYIHLRTFGCPVLNLGLVQHLEDFPEAHAITNLLIHRRCCRNFSPETLAMILRALPRLSKVHMERWRYVNPRNDTVWDESFGIFMQNLPTRLRSLTIFEKHQVKALAPQSDLFRKRSNTAKWLFNSSQMLSQLSISNLIDAQEFLTPPQRYWCPHESGCDTPEPDIKPTWQNLTYLALTADILSSRSDAAVNDLLLTAAEVAKRMPKLKIMELWKDGEEPAVFRYRVTDRKSHLFWKGTWIPSLDKLTLGSWRDVNKEHTDGRHELGVHIELFKGPMAYHGVIQNLVMREFVNAGIQLRRDSMDLFDG